MSPPRFCAVALMALSMGLLLLSAGMFPGALAQHFSEITEPGDAMTDRSPRLAAAGDMLVAAWLAYDGPSVDILYRVRYQGTWSDVGKLVESAGNERDVALCSSGGKIYAAWATDSSQYTTGQDWDIALSVYEHGTGWSAPVELTAAGDTANDYSPFLVSYQGGVIALWHSFKGDDSHVIMSIFSSTGTVSGPFNLTDGWKGLNQNPAAAVLGGTLWMAWSSTDNRHTDGTDLDILVAPIDIQARAIGNVEQLSDPADTEDDLYPSILALDGRLYVAWQSRDKTLGPGDDMDLGLAVFRDGIWSTHGLSQPHDTGDDIFPHLFAFDGKPWIAWQCSDPSITGGDDWDIVAAEISDNALGTIWVVTEGKEHLDDGGTIVRGHDALQFGGDIIVAWETTNHLITDGTDRDIAMAALTLIAQEKTDDRDVTGIVPAFVIIGFLCGLAAFLIFRGQRGREDSIGKKPGRKKRQNRN